jgi:hypothetical protein
MAFGAPFPGGNAALTQVFTGNAGTTSATGSFTASGISFGAAAPNRSMACFVSTISGVGNIPTSVTIGGVAATEVVAVLNGNDRIGLWMASVPTGATGNVVVSVAGSFSCRIMLYAIYGLSSLTPAQTASSTATPLTDSVTVNGGGVVIAGAVSQAGASAAWTGLTQDVFATSGVVAYTSASLTAALSQTVPISCTFSVATLPAMVAAGFNP